MKRIATAIIAVCAVSLLTSCITVRSPSSGHKRKAPPKKARKAPPKKHGRRAFTNNETVIIHRNNAVEINGVTFSE